MALILALSLAAAALSALFHPRKPAWFRVASPEEARWHINLEEAIAIQNEGKPLWIDARSRVEFDQGHVESAIILNTGEWGDLMFNHMDRLQDAMNRSAIVYGEGSQDRRSEEVAKRLRELLGLEPVYVLQGDWRLMDSAVEGKPATADSH